MKTFSLTLLLCLVSGCADPTNDLRNAKASADRFELIADACPPTTVSAQHISIAELTSNPSRYDGRVVSVSGYYSFYFEHSAVYSTQETKIDKHSFSDGIWIAGVPIASKHLDGQFLKFVGTFSSKKSGHFNQWPGAICVTSIEDVSPDAA